MGTRESSRTKSPVQIAALVVGAVFLLVGILGFVPGITTDYDLLGGAGHHSGAKLLGIFQVSVLHNLRSPDFRRRRHRIRPDRTDCAPVPDRRRCGLSRSVDLRTGDRPGQCGELRAGQHGRQLAALRTRRRNGRARILHGAGRVDARNGPDPTTLADGLVTAGDGPRRIPRRSSRRTRAGRRGCGSTPIRCRPPPPRRPRFRRRCGCRCARSDTT